jgi:hypothetical protein
MINKELGNWAICDCSRQDYRKRSRILSTSNKDVIAGREISF